MSEWSLSLGLKVRFQDPGHDETFLEKTKEKEI
jgi:hypothetical protein